LAIRQSLLTLLKKENEAWIQKDPQALQLMSQRFQVEIQQLNQQLLEKEKRLERLRQVFQEKANQIRDIVQHLLGYELQMDQEKVRLKNTRHLAEIEFDMISQSIRLLRTNDSLSNLWKIYVEQQQWIPGLLAAITLNNN
jgi:mitotic spindle assembly checkpoint protein MAD1